MLCNKCLRLVSEDTADLTHNLFFFFYVCFVSEYDS